MFQIAAGVILGCGVIWCLAIGARYKEYRICLVAGFVMTVVVIGAVLLNDLPATARVSCGDADPLCIRD